MGSFLTVGALVLVLGMVVGPTLWQAHGVWAGAVLLVVFLVSQVRETAALYRPHCRLEVAAAATVCPHCTRDMPRMAG